MKKSAHRHSRGATRAPARGGEKRLLAALRAQSPDALDLFTDRDDDAGEYQSLLRDFERVREEAIGAERYN